MGAAGPQPGFQFDLCKRNAFLEERGVQAPRLTKTGTTIAGIIFKVCTLQKQVLGTWLVTVGCHCGYRPH